MGKSLVTQGARGFIPQQNIFITWKVQLKLVWDEINAGVKEKKAANDTPHFCADLFKTTDLYSSQKEFKS